MPTRDINNDVASAQALLPQVLTATATGTTVDMLGYNGCLFVVNVGTVTDGTFAFSIEHSDDDNTYASASSYLSGSFTNATSSADEVVQEVAYTGSKRYVHLKVTVTGSPGTGGPIGAVAIRTNPRRKPA